MELVRVLGMGDRTTFLLLSLLILRMMSSGFFSGESPLTGFKILLGLQIDTLFTSLHPQYTPFISSFDPFIPQILVHFHIFTQNIQKVIKV